MASLRTRALVTALLLAALARPANAEPPSDDARAQARGLMQQGARQMDDRQYDKAVESFAEAYRLVPSPKVLYNLGIAYLSVARYADALKALEGFLAEATDAPAANVETARRHVADLRAKVVTLSIQSDRSGADLTLDGRALGAVTFDRPLTIDPGPHELRAQAGTETASQTFTAPPGQAFTVTLAFAAPAPAVPAAPPPAVVAPPLVTVASSSRPVYRRPVFWAVVGGAAAVTAAVVLALTLSRTEYPHVDTQVAGP